MTGGLSVVIPTYNEEGWIEGTLLHLEPSRQSIPLEVIVSDDGSTDRTVEIARKFADRVLSVPTGPCGRSVALNRGARVARHDVLLFLDADIRIDPMQEFLRETQDVFEGERGVVGGMIDFFVHPQEQTFADRLAHVLWNTFMHGVLRATGIGISTPGFQMARREAFDRIGGYDEDLRLTQDVDYSLRLSRVGQIHYFRRARAFESPRRYRDEGYLVYAYRSSLRWGSILLLGRSHGTYKAVR